MITQAELTTARQEALDAIADATLKKNTAYRKADTLRAHRDQMITAARAGNRLARVEEAANVGTTSVINAGKGLPHPQDLPPATLEDVRSATAAYAATYEQAQIAYDDWVTLLLTEYDRQLLRPTEIYRAANISKQRCSILRRQREQQQQPATPARTHLPPDQEQVAAAWNALAPGAAAAADALVTMPAHNTTSTSAAYGPTFTEDGAR